MSRVLIGSMSSVMPCGKSEAAAALRLATKVARIAARSACAGAIPAIACTRRQPVACA